MQTQAEIGRLPEWKPRPSSLLGEAIACHLGDEAFDPTLEELDAARTFVDRHEKALSGGHGVHVDEDGHMVDEAFVRRARRVVHNSHRGI